MKHNTENETTILSESQEQEILERDRQYEVGETKIYSLEEVIAYFNTRNITGA